MILKLEDTGVFCVTVLWLFLTAPLSTGGPACLPPDHCGPPGFRSGEGPAKRRCLQPQDPQQSQEDPA